MMDTLPIGEPSKLIKTKMPRRVSPMLATLTHEHFSHPGWIYERKLDGERCIVYKEGDSVHLRSRNDIPINDNYPEIAQAIKNNSDHDVVADGEIVAFRGNLTSFSLLQSRMKVKNPEEALISKVKVFLYLFDILHIDGYDTTGLELLDRKDLLEYAFNFRDPLRFSAHIIGEGEAYYKKACKKGWEGIIAKRAASRYVFKRSRDWLKFKCSNEQEFVIGGYTEPSGKRLGFGALLVGYYDDSRLLFAGRVGTGFDEKTLCRLHKKLSPIEQDTSPFCDNNIKKKGVHWVKPELIAQVGFTEWTAYRRLRHPRFLGLRRDKIPEEVKREV
jgi:DNA ligase D-like protein (predicted ligase)